MEQADLTPEDETEMLHQQVRHLTGWTMPEIRTLSYFDMVRIITFENKMQNRRN